ncbi:hypothetical protein BJ508DRAFT_23724 [Ascobolus immersus RN42]|uniref:Uncharacterized protein n=1 Tax=Ascobolus immersus RN42 TaxID=1160509 RepID=A0A3N4HN33_ASCIM|nr:hypothetical protein BJ508DRAFT_23724 [Ascobolus immersus RN42]
MPEEAKPDVERYLFQHRLQIPWEDHVGTFGNLVRWSQKRIQHPSKAARLRMLQAFCLIMSRRKNQARLVSNPPGKTPKFMLLMKKLASGEIALQGSMTTQISTVPRKSTYSRSVRLGERSHCCQYSARQGVYGSGTTGVWIGCAAHFLSE